MASRGDGTVAASRGPPVLVPVSVLVLVLAGANILFHTVSGSSLWVGAPIALALVLLARARHVSWHELGLARDQLSRGARWGAAIIVLVALAFLVGVVMPFTRTLFLDSRYHHGAAHALAEALVIIPLGTVLLEEVAFRCVLWAVLRRRFSTPWVVGLTSVAFGAWHVLPSLHLSSDNAGVGDVFTPMGSVGHVLSVAAAVAFTALGGVVFAELRRRTDSALTSMAAHWATNGLGVLFGVVAWRLDR